MSLRIRTGCGDFKVGLNKTDVRCTLKWPVLGQRDTCYISVVPRW